MKQKRKITYSFYCDAHMVEILKQVSDETGITQGELIRRALEKEFNASALQPTPARKSA